MATSQSFEVGPVSGSLLGYRRITWDVEGQRPLIGDRGTETDGKGLWVAQLRGVDLLFYNGRFIRAANYTEEERETFTGLINIMAHPRKRAEFLGMLDNICFEKGTKYV